MVSSSCRLGNRNKKMTVMKKVETASSRIVLEHMNKITIVDNLLYLNM